MGSTGKSVVDYVIASQSVFSLVNTFRVHDPNILSDHCLLSFSLVSSAQDGAHEKDESSLGSPLDHKYVWDSSQLEAYQSALETDAIKAALTNLQKQIFFC